MAIRAEHSVWPEDYYPGVHEKRVEELSLEFERGRNVDKLKSVRKRGRRDRSSTQPSVKYIFEKPVFPDDIITRILPLYIAKGKPLDIISLLSLNTGYSDCKSFVRFHQVAGRLVTTECVEDIQTYFKGKYVLLLCFYVPVDFIAGSGCRVMEYSLFAQEMMSKYPGKFETVLVVKMNPNWSDEEAVFRHFISGFSSSCLVVPFRDTTRIDAICRSVNLQGSNKGILVDPHGIVLQDSLKFVGSIDFIDSFPSTNYYNRPRLSENWRNQTLDQLLGCGELTRCHSVDRSASVSVSELAKNKVVGLYLCGTGHHIPLLHKLYNKCRAQHLDFEVVLVYVPFISWYPPEVIQDVIDPYLIDNKIPFWVSPFNYTVSLRLFYVADWSPSDKLLIVSYGKLVEVDGERLISSRLGINAYPFDRESLIHKALGEIEKLTLESLLEGGSLRRGNKPSDEVSVTCIKGENVILFLGSVVRYLDMYQLMEKHYDEIKQKHAGFEVVFVCIDDTISPPMEECISCMPWLVFRPDCSRAQFVIQALSLWGVKLDPCLVAFGEDGLICSLDPEDALKQHGSDAFPFSADLRKQIANSLDECLAKRIGP